MSLVQVILTDEFVLAAAETRAVKPDGLTIDGCNKMIKVNNEIIFGCTGGIKDNYKLFYGFCDYSNQSGLVKLEKTVSISYIDFIEMIINRFNEMRKIHDDPNNKIKFEIMSIVCGYNGKKFEAVLFSLASDNCNGITTIHKPSNFPFKCISAGKIEHKEEFDRIANYYHENTTCDFTTILQYKNILREVFTNGAKNDSEINSDIKFEKIKRKDVMKH